MPPRFYVPEARANDAVIDLPEEEAAHLIRVLRLTTGDDVRVFNGRGDEWNGHVDHATKQRASVRLASRVPPAAEARVAISLCLAILKSDKMDDAIRDAVMLGVADIQPLVTARTEFTRTTLVKSGRVGRWQRIAVASAKQCGRAVVPVVREPRTVDEVLVAARDVVMLVEPAAASATISLRALPATHAVTLLVGPEGGWSDPELQAARDNGAMLLTLGTLTLRADAVPIVALTALRVRLEDW